MKQTKNKDREPLPLPEILEQRCKEFAEALAEAGCEVLVLVSCVNAKEGTTHTFTSCHGNYYASVGLAQEWLNDA